MINDIMKASSQKRKRSPCCRLTELLVSMACIPHIAAAFVTPSHSSLLPAGDRAAAGMPQRILTQRYNIAVGGDDFASFQNDFAQYDEARELAREFYQELEHRQRSNDEKDPSYGGGKQLANQQTVTAADSSNEESSPVFDLFSSLSFLAPKPRQTKKSAGLFSNPSATVDSDGPGTRSASAQADIELLETAMQNDEYELNDMTQKIWLGITMLYMGVLIKIALFHGP